MKKTDPNPSNLINSQFRVKVDFTSATELLQIIRTWKLRITDTQHQSYKDTIWTVQFHGLSSQLDRIKEQLSNWLIPEE